MVSFVVHGILYMVQAIKKDTVGEDQVLFDALFFFKLGQRLVL